MKEVEKTDAKFKTFRSNPAEDGEMSKGEKDLYCMILPEVQSELDYPLQELEMAFGPAEQEYIIPDKDKEKVLKDLWPLKSTFPGIDEEWFDLHSQKEFRIRDYRVIRCRERNMLVAPDYPHTGGMLVDWMPSKDTSFYGIKAK